MCQSTSATIIELLSNKTILAGLLASAAIYMVVPAQARLLVGLLAIIVIIIVTSSPRDREIRRSKDCQQLIIDANNYPMMMGDQQDNNFDRHMIGADRIEVIDGGGPPVTYTQPWNSNLRHGSCYPDADTQPGLIMSAYEDHPYMYEYRPVQPLYRSDVMNSDVQGIVDRSVDTEVTRQGFRRNNNKKSIEGYNVKNKNYYSRHYGDELTIAEQKRWW